MRRRPRQQISLLVPFRSSDPRRLRVWMWLRRYWMSQLTGCEIVVGRDRKSRPTWWGRRKPIPFSKTAAVNDAFRRSHGDIIVILDADAYLPATVITQCAERIRKAREAGVHLWFIPYRWIFRLTEEATERLLDTCPDHPFAIPTPPPKCDVEGTEGSGWGHTFGALVQIMPREAFECVGGMDPRFRGWGGEDVSNMIALDTLWGKHKNTPNEVLHLWHPKTIAGEWTSSTGKVSEVRSWAGQETGFSNDWLSKQYHNARWQKEKMRKLLDEAHEA